ncbi:DNA-directed DNA polymerase [Tanacetum coccineum]
MISYHQTGIMPERTFEMAPKRATRSTSVIENPITTTVTNAQLSANVTKGVTAALSTHYKQEMAMKPYFRNGSRRTAHVCRWFARYDSGSVVASKPKTMQEATEMATELMDKKINTFAERQAENKRKLDNNHQAQQQLPKRQNVCKFHHNGPCTVKCANCKRVGHLTRDCWSSAATNNQRTLTCYECGNQGHYKSDCPKLKNRNHGNQAEGTGTHGMVLALGGGETDQDPNHIEDEIEA